MDEDAVDDDQDSIERWQNQSETAAGAKTNIANASNSILIMVMINYGDEYEAWKMIIMTMNVKNMGMKMSI